MTNDSGPPLFPSRVRYHIAPKQPQRLRVITLANPKGGVGKTTVASALAVRAAEESKRVALLDLDPQESLSSWWTRRGKTKNPKLFEVDAAVEAIELLISEGWHWVFVDTGPARIDLIESGVAVSDLVLIPTRPSAFDIEQTALCVELCENHSKPYAFVLNHAPPGNQVDQNLHQVPATERRHGNRCANHVSDELHGGDNGRQVALWVAVKKLVAEKVA